MRSAASASLCISIEIAFSVLNRKCGCSCIFKRLQLRLRELRLELRRLQLALRSLRIIQCPVDGTISQYL